MTTNATPLPSLSDLFPYHYCGGGYWRKAGVPVGHAAETLHGDKAVEYLYDEICKLMDLKETP